MTRALLALLALLAVLAVPSCSLKQVCQDVEPSVQGADAGVLR